MFLYSVRFNGKNLERILSIIFDGDTDLQSTIFQSKLKSFDKDIVDRKFERFCTKINNGYLPTNDFTSI